MSGQLWLLKVALSHLLTDFVFQPGKWVEERRDKHFASPKLYLHGLVTAAGVLILAGPTHWVAALVIFITHVLIDGWKSYQKDLVLFFALDQLFHLVVILGCWYFTFSPASELRALASQVGKHNRTWALVTGAVFLTAPAGILIGQLTRGWREKINNPESLANAGKWIGIIERIIVYILMLLGQYAAISLLIAAKGIIRFNEKDRPEVKTEYLVIGTLLSIAIAMLVGITVNKIFPSI